MSGLENFAITEIKRVLRECEVAPTAILACQTRIELIELAHQHGIRDMPDEWTQQQWKEKREASAAERALVHTLAALAPTYSPQQRKPKAAKKGRRPKSERTRASPKVTRGGSSTEREEESQPTGWFGSSWLGSGDSSKGAAKAAAPAPVPSRASGASPPKSPKKAKEKERTSPRRSPTKGKGGPSSPPRAKAAAHPHSGGNAPAQGSQAAQIPLVLPAAAETAADGAMASSAEGAMVSTKPIAESSQLPSSKRTATSAQAKLSKTEAKRAMAAAQAESGQADASPPSRGGGSSSMGVAVAEASGARGASTSAAQASTAAVTRANAPPKAAAASSAVATNAAPSMQRRPEVAAAEGGVQRGVASDLLSDAPLHPRLVESPTAQPALPPATDTSPAPIAAAAPKQPAAPPPPPARERRAPAMSRQKPKQAPSYEEAELPSPAVLREATQRIDITDYETMASQERETAAELLLDVMGPDGVSLQDLQAALTAGKARPQKTPRRRAV